MATGREEMTAVELAELGGRVAPVDPSAVPAAVLARLVVHNRRVRMLDTLLRRARLVLDSGARIEPALAQTIRFAAAALDASRARLLEDLQRSGR